MLQTDHSSLRWLQSFKEPDRQVARWLESIQEFDFVVQHHQGTLHNNADSLSRYPGMLEQNMEHPFSTIAKEDASVIALLTAQTILTECSPEEFRELQRVDEVLGPLDESIEAKQKPSPNATGGKDRSYTLLLQQWDQLYLQDGLLFPNYQDTSGKHHWAQLVVLKFLQEEVIYMEVQPVVTWERKRH